jgi:hypothetical protein
MKDGEFLESLFESFCRDWLRAYSEVGESSLELFVQLNLETSFGDLFWRAHVESSFGATILRGH